MAKMIFSEENYFKGKECVPQMQTLSFQSRFGKGIVYRQVNWKSQKLTSFVEMAENQPSVRIQSLQET